MSAKAIFGRYVPVESVVHRLDPRTKLLLALVFIGVALCAQNEPSLVCVAVAIFAFYACARISFVAAFRSIAPLLFIVIITALINLFWVQGGTVYVSWGIVHISQAGVSSAVFLSCRLVLLLLGASLLTLTTTALDITDGFERLLAPFSRFGFPAHELSMMMGIALRFLPQFASELVTVYHAQISRGASFSGSAGRGGVRMLTSLLVPLFSSAFRHADTLAYAMDARCYHGGSGRTRLHPLAYERRDICAWVLLAALCAVILALNVLV